MTGPPVGESAATARGRLEPLATAWGGLIGTIGLMVGLALEPAPRALLVGIAFFIGGALAGSRALGRRLAHALAAAVFGYALFHVFIVLATAISRIGGPDAPEVSESPQNGAATAIIAVVASLTGGLLAGRRSSSARR